MKQTDDPRLLHALVSHRVLVLSNTLALAASRYYLRRFGIRLAEWRVIDALHAGRGISANRISHGCAPTRPWGARSRPDRRGPCPPQGGPGARAPAAAQPDSQGERMYAGIAPRRDAMAIARRAIGAERECSNAPLGKLQARAVLCSPETAFGFGKRDFAEQHEMRWPSVV